MQLPVIHGYIDRRILINFTVAPHTLTPLLPAPFRPKLYKSQAIAGICLIRLTHIKPKGWPDIIGIRSENAAHRIAVEWDEDGITKEGVYIPRRDTSSRWNALAGGRIFPGKHHLAKFRVAEEDGRYQVGFTSNDDTHISIDASICGQFPATSIFDTLENASAFFEKGSMGYSPGRSQTLDGLCLQAYRWEVKPLQLQHVASSFFDNTTMFPKGTVHFDNALLMTGIEHEWRSLKTIA